MEKRALVVAVLVLGAMAAVTAAAVGMTSVAVSITTETARTGALDMFAASDALKVWRISSPRDASEAMEFIIDATAGRTFDPSLIVLTFMRLEIEWSLGRTIPWMGDRNGNALHLHQITDRSIRTALRSGVVPFIRRVLVQEQFSAEDQREYMDQVNVLVSALNARDIPSRTRGQSH